MADRYRGRAGVQRLHAQHQEKYKNHGRDIARADKIAAAAVAADRKAKADDARRVLAEKRRKKEAKRKLDAHMKAERIRKRRERQAAAKRRKEERDRKNRERQAAERKRKERQQQVAGKPEARVLLLEPEGG